MRLLVLGAMVAWVFFGDPADTTANAMWPDSAAPWEEVRAFYYPDRNDLSRSSTVHGLTSLAECRGSVSAIAAENGDPNLVRGDYECGIGCDDTEAGFEVCRITAR